MNSQYFLGRGDQWWLIAELAQGLLNPCFGKYARKVPKIEACHNLDFMRCGDCHMHCVGKGIRGQGFTLEQQLGQISRFVAYR